MRRCYLIRHAQTAWNGENRLQGHSDRPLSALGLRQAQAVGCHVKTLIDGQASRTVLYTSHLQRSRQTAEALACQTGLLTHVEPDLAEIGLGAWEGLTPEEIDARYAGAYQVWRLRPSAVTIPDAEPLVKFHARIRAAFRRILQTHQVSDVVIVSHGGVIASLLAECLAADYDQLLRRLALDNAGITLLDCHTQPPQILWINATQHLDMLTND